MSLKSFAIIPPADAGKGTGAIMDRISPIRAQKQKTAAPSGSVSQQNTQIIRLIVDQTIIVIIRGGAFFNLEIKTVGCADLIFNFNRDAAVFFQE